jgi:RNA polymerase sigma-70 factor (ECF subfamily)
MSHLGGLRDLAGMIEAVEHDARQAGTYIERLFEAHERRLGQFLVHVVRDRALAEDLLQETFLAAWKARDDLDFVENPEAWLFGIARHRALHALRGAQRFRRAVARMAVAPAIEDEGPALAVDTLALLHRTLGPEDRALMVLCYVHGFGAPELAEMTGRSPAAIRKRLERARTALLKEVER